ncbi:MAG: DNA-binding response regulator [Dehalococcoidia bacterium]|nr:MAG: DNA-binding response regulator [Dehalococcoidia bacterium]
MNDGKKPVPAETILVVDDEPTLVDLTRTTLEREGYTVIEASNGLEALGKVRDLLPDLVLLDVMMPEMDGFETLKAIREFSNVPIIMLTVQDSEASKVRGLELGADDYVSKTAGRRELVSRIRAVLRRARMARPPSRSIVRIDDDLTVDFDRREVIVRGHATKLRPTEYKLLHHLIQNAGRLMTHEQLLTKVWGREYRDDTQLLRLYITYLRQKIEPDPSKPKYILNERGMGYRFAEHEPGAE